ncbi:MAG: polysulfide reductase NrfD [Negativicutes bacterium]|nr:polysulfide reductase NrfD [Negativicutes bacterium]
MDQIWGSLAQYQEVQWGWPIAFYLFIAGLSAGALISALLIKRSAGQGQWRDGLVKAGAIIAPLAIMVGQGLLVLDLGKPFSFYLLMIHFQLTSVMSIGVILLMAYTALSMLFFLIVFKEEAGRMMKQLLPLAEAGEGAGLALDFLMGLSAVSIAVYTGFLLSVLVAKPLLNIAVLPLLFLISGMSAGVAANIVAGVLFFRSSVGERNLRYLLTLDMKLIPSELFVLFILFVGLVNMGGSYAIVARQALSTGVWAQVFWIGVVGIGLILPIIMAFTALHRFEQAGKTATLTAGGGGSMASSGSLPISALVMNSAFVLVGVVLLRFYLLYAGQIFIGN